jgi:hypothetical protein
MEFKISPNNKTIEEQPFFNGESILKFVGFPSAIVGLKLNLYDANGKTLSKPIFNTEVDFNLEISKFGSVGFEFVSTDKEYTIVLDID